MRYNYYQLTLLADPDLSQEKAEELIRKVSETIKQKEGLVDKEERPIRRQLKYPIKKRLAAFFGSINFSLGPEKISALKEALDGEKGIIRYLIVKLKKEKERKIVLPRVKPKAPPSLKEQAPRGKPEKVELKEIEKKLEEILGK